MVIKYILEGSDRDFDKLTRLDLIVVRGDRERVINYYHGTGNALFGYTIQEGGGKIAQSLASLSTKRAIQVRARLDSIVRERWNSITVLLTRSHQCQQLVKKRLSMCYYVCVIMHVKDP